MIGYINKALKRIQAGPCYPAAGWEMVPILRDAWIERCAGASSGIKWDRHKHGLFWYRHPWRPEGMSRNQALAASGFDDGTKGFILVRRIAPDQMCVHNHNAGMCTLTPSLFRPWGWLEGFSAVPDAVEIVETQEELRHQAHNRPADASRWDLLMQELRLDGIARPHVKSNEVSQRFALLELS